MEYFRFGVRLSLGFLIAGTGILILFYFNPSARIALTAYQFTVIAVVASWIYVIILLINMLRRRISIPVLIKTLGVMAINIPIGIFYSQIMVWLLGYARVTFENNTGQIITVLNIRGCEKKTLESLENESTKTAWIKISENCHVEVSYTLDGEMKKELVIANVAKGEGVRIFYKLKK
jgi:hypothetical protein